MSNTYYVLCMSHDPCTMVSECRTKEDAVVGAKKGYSEHPHCFLMVMVVSGAPIEFGCLGGDKCCGHTMVEWADADWLRLLHHVRMAPTAEVQTLLRKSTFRCWSPEIISRLRIELGLTES